MSKINVLHLMNNFDDASISRIVFRLIKYLGHERYCWHVGALSDAGDMQSEFDCLGAKTVSFSEKRDNYLSNNVKEIKDYILSHKIRIVHTHTPRTILKVILSRPPGTIHVATKHILFSPGDRRWGAIHTLWDRLGLYMPDQVVAVSKTMYHQIIAQPGVNKNRVAMVRNAIPVEHFYAPEQRDSLRSELGIPQDSLIIGYSGRIEKVKRIDLLLLAFSEVLARFPRAYLVLAGEGDLKFQMQDYANKLGVGNAVFWLGFCREMPRFLAAIDVYIQPSSNEGLSLSILEAMAAGKPVIATNVGGANEVLIEMETGLLIPSKSPLAISSAIIDLLEHPEKRLGLGGAARERVLKEFNLQAMVDAYGVIYQKFTP